MVALHLLWLFAIGLRAVAGGSFFPCHAAKSSVHNEVKCTSVNLPPSICGNCPLRETLRDGSFEQCDRVYDTTSSTCIGSLQQYVDDNPCDTRRAAALQQLKDGDESARDELDYFLYSVCEQCCDCVPMGVQTADYSQLSKQHSPSSPALWAEARGNCPAHARYDVCKILPSIRSFGSLSNDVPICSQLINWERSDAAEDWPTNPQVAISDDIQSFLRDMLVATQCDERTIWRNCQIMEDKQHHLDLPAGSEFESAPVSGATPHATPAPIPEAADASADSSLAATDPASEGEQNVSDAGTADGSGDQTVAPDQSPSDFSAIDSAVEGGDTGASASGTDSSSTESAPAGESSSDSDGSGLFVPPILQGMRSCFPASSTVQRSDGAIVQMEELRVGDEVLASSGKYSPIYTFSHRSHDAYTEFVHIRTKNHSLSLSSEHNLYVNGRMRYAGLVKEGEFVRGLLGEERVLRVSREWQWGLYNPHTIDGEIVVDGVVCSCFTGAVSTGVAQGLLTPVRSAFSIGGTDWLLGWWLKDGLDSFLFWNGR
ncbi:unnamed protein product [Agarophyton chilense]|eukprot:gb/GEZJ01001491.1/.p1 GENE.gb/GEZJ01001491.1/~~gb/GEZJ01001491.1/.p1  ORF type:complete len:543 (-),score=58.31 gb/GEZJ01001491.1/:2344-3972(-)